MLRNAAWEVWVSCGAKTDLLCKGGVWYATPVAVFVEIYWEGHQRAQGLRVYRKREKRVTGEDNGRGEHKQQQQQQWH